MWASFVAPGATDPNWRETYAGPSGPPIGTPPTTCGPAFANRNSASWLPNGPASGWITPSQPPGQSELGGQYVYCTVFDGVERFKGRYSSDNELLEVFLNGVVLTGFPLNGPADFDKWTDFGYISTGLVPLGNTLHFVVRNRGVGGIDANPTVTGFRAEFTVPEPSTVGLCLVGLGSFIFSRRRSKQGMGLTSQRHA